jgi:hypothetical protein
MESNSSLSDLLETYSLSRSSAISLCLERDVPTIVVAGFILIFVVLYLAALIGNFLFLVAVFASRGIRTHSMAITSIVCLSFLIYQLVLTPLIVWHVRSCGVLLATNTTVCQVFGFVRMVLDLGCLFTLLILAMETLFKVSQPYRYKVTKAKLTLQFGFIWIYSVSLSLVSLNTSNRHQFLYQYKSTGLCGLNLSNSDGLVIVYLSVLSVSILLSIIASSGILHFVCKLYSQWKTQRQFLGAFNVNPCKTDNPQARPEPVNDSMPNADTVSYCAYRWSLQQEFTTLHTPQQAISTVLCFAIFLSCLLTVYTPSLVNPQSYTWPSVNSTCKYASCHLKAVNGHTAYINSSQIDELVLCKKMAEHGISGSSQSLSFLYMLIVVLPSSIIPYVLGLRNPTVIAFYKCLFQVCKAPEEPVEVQLNENATG